MSDRTFSLAVSVGLTVAAVIGVTVLVAPYFMFPPDDISVFWPTNGIVLGLLLVLPIEMRRGAMLVLLPAYLAAELLIGHPVGPSVGFTIVNGIELLLAFWRLALE